MSRASERPRGIDIVTFDGGGAHRSAAFALRDALHREREGDVRVVDALDMFAGAKALHGILETGIRTYNASLKSERVWFGDLGLAMRAGTRVARALTPSSFPTVQKFYAEGAPRLTVSFVPMVHRLVFESLARVRHDSRGMVVPVDFKEIHSNYWFDPLVDVEYLCGTDRLAVDALAAGVPPQRVKAVNGMVTHPKFSGLSSFDVARERARLGLDPKLPTVLLFFGGQGSRQMVEMAKALDASPSRQNLVVIAGRDEETFRTLSSWESRSPKHVVGFTEEVERLMRLSDVLVGKPGPVSIHEALACGLPLVLWDNPAFHVLFDENLRWVEHEGVGLRVRSVEAIPAAVHRVLSSKSFRHSAEKLRGHATRDVVAHIERHLDGAFPRPQLSLVARC